MEEVRQSFMKWLLSPWISPKFAGVYSHGADKIVNRGSRQPPPKSWFTCTGSGIRDPGSAITDVLDLIVSGIRDPGSGISDVLGPGSGIRDPQSRMYSIWLYPGSGIRDPRFEMYWLRIPDPGSRRAGGGCLEPRCQLTQPLGSRGFHPWGQTLAKSKNLAHTISETVCMMQIDVKEFRKPANWMRKLKRSTKWEITVYSSETVNFESFL